MSLFSASDRAFARILARLAYANPFLPERVALEREALGDAFTPVEAVWNWRADIEGDRPNLSRLGARAGEVAGLARDKLAGGMHPTDEERQIYEDIVLYLLYHRYRFAFQELIDRAARGGEGPGRVGGYEKFLRDVERHFSLPGVRSPNRQDPAHLFACFFQLRRAFVHLFGRIVGGSMPAARLRAAAWQSIFTHDMRRYRRALYARMGDLTTLITGPSGTGKELVAEAIGLSRYVPFDPRAGAFVEDYAAAFHAVNLSALPPTLVEAELFGYRRGAFTGAVADRAGWLEVCPASGTVFLDEIGDLAPEIQVKLLRVLQSRTFQRLGDTEPRRFFGKIVAATNRDLTAEIRAGRFREDLYYRLCSDLVVTPSLRDQLREAPEELHNLVRFIARRVAGEEGEALADEVQAWIEKHLGPGYPWPGNVRELEQCVRNVMVRKEYRPPRPDAAARGPREALAEAARQGSLTVDELLRRYCTLVYAQTRNYEEVARRLRIDRRTAKAHVDPKLLEEFRSSTA